MKQTFPLFFFCTISIVIIQCKTGLVTMNNSCYNSIQQGQSANKAGNYSNALDLFSQVLQKCDAYDAKEKGYAGKAAALNGLQKYNDALDAANQGLNINKSSIDNLFEKATAELSLNKSADAKNDFNTIIDLTQKNRNTTERATIYAKIAEVDFKQNMYDDASNNIEQAISLDAGNASFYMLRGDIKATKKNFAEAIADYDIAISKGKDDAEVWKAKTVTSIKSFQEKYKTPNAQQLVTQISASDKQSLCRDIQNAKNKGVTDMNIDLLQVSLCK
jgi:tetratricopeptide (TPR) repeat protein